MTSLNRQRANIVFSTILESDSAIDLENLRSGDIPTKPKNDTASWTILTPAQVSQQERIFHRSALEWTTPTQTHDLGTAEIGIPLASFFKHSQTTNTTHTNLPIHELTTLFTHESYILYLYPTGPKWHASILLKNNCPVPAQLKAWTHALLAARVLSTSHPPMQSILPILSTTLSILNTRFPEYIHALSEADWNTSISALETHSGRRVTLA